MVESELQNLRDSERTPAKARIEFRVNSDLIDGESIDISKSGISFETFKPIVVEMHVYVDEKRENHEAKVVWSKELTNGKHRYGLKFVDEESSA